MELVHVLLIVLAVFLLLLATETPIALCLALSGAVGIGLTRGWPVASASLAGAPFESVARYGLSIVPMYILVGMFAVHSRIADHVFQIADRALERVRGGLGVATVAACAGFAAVTGSSVATAATIGRLSIRQMRARGYPASLAAGIVAAAGTLGILIPPSIILAIYGVLTRESIATLLVAGIVPGAASALIYAVYLVVRGDGQGASDATVDRPAAARERVAWKALPWRGLFRVVVLFAIIMVGVYTGIFTVTESGALGAFFALVIMLVELRRERFRSILRGLSNALQEAAATTSMTFFVLVGSTVFTFFLVSAGVPTAFTRWLTELDIPAGLVVVVLLIALIPLGMALDSLSILIIYVPLTYPVVTELGYSGIWYGVLVVKMIELGQITPPVGINVYVVARVGDVSPEQTFRGIAPFALMDVVTVAVLIAFPGIVLWLPDLLVGPIG